MAGKDRKRHTSVLKTAQQIADKVNDTLPITLTTEDVDKNPELIKLLTTLSQQLTEDGLMKLTQRDLIDAEESMKQDKYRWLQQHILYHELQELLLDQEFKSVESTPSGTSKQFYQAVKECLSLAEIGDYLDCNPEPGTGVTLLGLKKEDIQRRNPHRKHLPSIQQKLIPEMESRLRKKCEVMVNFHDTTPDSQNLVGENRFTFAKASQLPSMLEMEKQSFEGEKQQLKQDRRQREKQFWHYYKALMESLALVEKLLTRHRLSAQKESDDINSSWLTARCEAMCLKIKMVELQLLCDTYYASTVEALTLIRDELEGTIHDTKRDLANISQALKAYEAIGPSFQTLIQEYTYIRDEIENKKWALRELQHSLEIEGIS